MTQEEKARAYDKAIERAKSLIGDTIIEESGQHIAEVIFPELKESEDEKIRKEMIFYFTEEIPQCSIQEHSDKMREFISWLKRQEVERTKLELKAGSSYFCYKSRWERADSETFKKGLIYMCNKDGVLDNFVIKNPEQHFIEIKDERITWLEKHGEQKKSYDTCDSSMMNNKKSPYGEKRDFGYFEEKPADKVEPKFHEGEWVLNDVCLPVQIASIKDDLYVFAEGDAMSVSFVDNNFHLWTLQDAKDGDILAFYSEYKGNKMIQVGIVKEYVGKHGGCSNTFNIYVGVNWDNNLQIGEYMGCSDIQPATKEQHDALMVAMADAGYVFDFEKKELKKFEKSEDKLFQYIIEERNKPYFYYNGKKDVSWNDMPYIVRKHDYPYHFVGNLDCFPFFSGTK